jgi:hypothetical protein
MAAKNRGEVWLVLVLLVGGVGAFALSPLAPWNKPGNVTPGPTPTPPYGPGTNRPGGSTTPAASGPVGRYEATVLEGGLFLITDTLTGEVFKASEADAKPHAERPKIDSRRLPDEKLPPLPGFPGGFPPLPGGQPQLPGPPGGFPPLPGSPGGFPPLQPPGK